MTYVLFYEPQPIERLGCSQRKLPPFTHVAGYSGLGHFFLHNAQTSEFAVCHPFRQAYKSYGVFESVAAFESTVLQDAGFAMYVLRPSHQAAIAERLGALGQDEVYIPKPYPFLGGTEAPESYEKGDFWVFAEIVGMCHGFA